MKPNTALLSIVWQETNTITLSQPDSMTFVNQDSRQQQQQKKMINHVGQKSKARKKPTIYNTCRNFNKGVCKKAKREHAHNAIRIVDLKIELTPTLTPNDRDSTPVKY